MRKWIPIMLLLFASCGDSRPAAGGGIEKRMTISRGKAFSQKDYLVPGYVSLLDFYADWCGPCRVLAPELDRLLAKYDRLVLRQVDVVDWDSAAAAQANKEFGLDAIPYLRVYDADGKFVGAVRGADAAAVEALVKKALALPAS